MSTPFSDIPPVQSTEEIIDNAFSGATKKASTKSGKPSQRAMTVTAANKLRGAINQVVKGYPSFEDLPEPYKALSHALIDVDETRNALGKLNWAQRQIDKISSETQREIQRSEDTEAAITARKQAFARYASITRELENEITLLREARTLLIEIPEITDEPTAVIAGHPNVGKSTLLDRLTTANPEINSYIYTTKIIDIGHIFHPDTNMRAQVIDTPGLLDRENTERNNLESQTIHALNELADMILYVVDPTETCGFSIEEQLSQLRRVKDETNNDIVLIRNKTDLESHTQPSLEFDYEESLVNPDTDLSDLRKRIYSELGIDHLKP